MFRLRLMLADHVVAYFRGDERSSRFITYLSRFVLLLLLRQAEYPFLDFGKDCRIYKQSSITLVLRNHSAVPTDVRCSASLGEICMCVIAHFENMIGTVQLKNRTENTNEDSFDNQYCRGDSDFLFVLFSSNREPARRLDVDLSLVSD